MFETVIGITCLALAGIIGLYLRFAPTYISNRSKRYIHPPRKGVKK